MTVQWSFRVGLLGFAMVLGLVLFAPMASRAALPSKPECSYPCGTQPNPTSVQAPVSLGVHKDDTVDEYAFLIYTELGADPVEQSEFTANNFYVSTSIAEKGTYRWRAVARNGDGQKSSDSFYFTVTKVCPAGSVCIQNPLTTSKFTDVVDRILNILFFVALAVSPVMIIVAGFRFLTGGGDPKNITAARQMLIWTAVGFGIIVLSKGIVIVLRSVIGF